MTIGQLTSCSYKLNSLTFDDIVQILITAQSIPGVRKNSVLMNTIITSLAAIEVYQTALIAYQNLLTAYTNAKEICDIATAILIPSKAPETAGLVSAKAQQVISQTEQSALQTSINILLNTEIPGT